MQINYGQMGILGGVGYHGNPSCMAADVNNTEEITVKRTEAKMGIGGASGSVSHHCEDVQMVDVQAIKKRSGFVRSCCSTLPLLPCPHRLVGHTHSPTGVLIWKER